MKATIEQAIEAIAELLTATHDYGAGKPNITISYLGPDFDKGEGWYVSLSEFRQLGSPLTAPKTVIFKGKYKTLREGLKAAAEFFAPTKLDELRTRVQSLAEKL